MIYVLTRVSSHREASRLHCSGVASPQCLKLSKASPGGAGPGGAEEATFSESWMLEHTDTGGVCWSYRDRGNKV